jgi:hypothetical protein
MKKTTLIIATSAMLNGMAETPTQYDGPTFSNTLNALSRSPDEETTLRFLRDATLHEGWWLGGGSGPSDHNTHQMRVLGLLTSNFLDANGQYTGTLRNSEDPIMQQWIDHLLISPSETEGILRLLNDPSPPVRSLGLRKVSFLDQLPNAIVTKLEDIVRTDDYVRMAIFRTEDPHPGKRPRNPGEGEYSDFNASLRNFAATILQRHGREDVAVDNAQVALLGLEQFNEYHKAGREVIVNGICVLGPHKSHGYAMWREARFNREEYPQLSALFQAWDARIPKGSIPSYALDEREKNEIALKPLLRPRVVAPVTLEVEPVASEEWPQEEIPSTPENSPPPSRPADRARLWWLALPAVAAGAWLVFRLKKRRK